MSTSENPSSRPRRPTPSKLPDYAHPPLVRVELGVRFATRSLTTELEARFRTELGSGWQQQERRPNDIPGLVWTTQLSDQRITLHEHGMDYRWNGLDGGHYPHYPIVREGFVSMWNAWCNAIETTPVVTKWVVRYVNQISHGTVWTSLADCSFLRWVAPFPATDGLPAPEGISASWRFPLDQFDARLHVELDSDVELRNSLKLQLICHGGVPNPDDTFLAGFDYGREVIVKTFRQLMQPAANEFWGLKV